MDEWLLDRVKNIVYNDSIYQDINDSRCGYYCVYTLNELSKGKDYKSILSHLKEYPNNNNNWKFLKQYFEMESK
jgi:hypothetical protein